MVDFWVTRVQTCDVSEVHFKDKIVQLQFDSAFIASPIYSTSKIPNRGRYGSGMQTPLISVGRTVSTLQSRYTSLETQLPSRIRFTI